MFRVTAHSLHIDSENLTPAADPARFDSLGINTPKTKTPEPFGPRVFVFKVVETVGIDSSRFSLHAKSSVAGSGSESHIVCASPREIALRFPAADPARFDSRRLQQSKQKQKALNLSVQSLLLLSKNGGDGGNRTHVQKPSIRNSTSLALRFSLSFRRPVSRLLQDTIGSYFAIHPPMRDEPLAP